MSFDTRGYRDSSLRSELRKKLRCFYPFPTFEITPRENGARQTSTSSA